MRLHPLPPPFAQALEMPPPVVFGRTVKVAQARVGAEGAPPGTQGDDDRSKQKQRTMDRSVWVGRIQL